MSRAVGAAVERPRLGEVGRVQRHPPVVFERRRDRAGAAAVDAVALAALQLVVDLLPRAMLAGELGTPSPIATGFGGCAANCGESDLM